MGVVASAPSTDIEAPMEPAKSAAPASLAEASVDEMRPPDIPLPRLRNSSEIPPTIVTLDFVDSAGTVATNMLKVSAAGGELEYLNTGERVLNVTELTETTDIT